MAGALRRGTRPIMTNEGLGVEKMLMRDGIMIAVLWRSGLFDSCDIADALGQAEADVLRVIEALRAGAAGPRLVSETQA